MTTPNPDPRVPATMPPAAPEEVTKKRDGLISGLDAAAKSATGTLQAVLRKMSELLANTKDGAQLNMNLYEDVKTAFNRHLKEAEKNPKLAADMPAVLINAVEWMQEYISSRGFDPAPAAAAAPAATAPAAAAAPGQAKVKDAFESSSAAKKRAVLTGDVPPPPSVAATPAAKPADAQEVQKDLESFKAWMKNPALGKLKG
ncbi:hypothetical protein JYK02_28140 [Corallococcus macrosporus]|uniref:Uncharacterized protein n=1 Tax=Corallococcus macrosporus TaxID=35 RepID=A0ABS3DJA0_9BACT|nr:hypothetical protein [Corallococcus macrosporus]MBN8231388.1 hypothetical protein [Corallococcus macrosporus]